MNKNKHYLISDASRQVQVEAHVLRYWEDELGLPIPRNELGHRYYTEFHIQLFRQIKQLKEQGYQLKAIRGILGKVEENQKTEPEALLEAQAQAVFRETGTNEKKYRGRKQGNRTAAGRGFPASGGGEDAPVSGDHEPGHRARDRGKQRKTEPGCQLSGA